MNLLLVSIKKGGEKSTIFRRNGQRTFNIDAYKWFLDKDEAGKV